jgi:hypothetical protein
MITLPHAVPLPGILAENDGVLGSSAEKMGPSHCRMSPAGRGNSCLQCVLPLLVVVSNLGISRSLCPRISVDRTVIHVAS